MNKAIYGRLSIMMFLQFFVGARGSSPGTY
jgi:hypothetical protein